jgi:probable dihydroxyacetone kinase regulator
MAMAIHDTKKLLSMSLIELLSGKTLEKISVGDIVAGAGAGRQTFYNHFRDKYDLCYWFIASNADNKARRHQITASGDQAWQAFLMDYLYFVKENQKLFCPVCEIQSANTLAKRLVDHFCGIYRSFFEDAGEPPAKARKQSQRADFHIVFYCHGILAVIKEWLRDGLKENPQTLSEKLASVHSAMYYSGTRETS